jgi:hypothetical protein
MWRFPKLEPLSPCALYTIGKPLMRIVTENSIKYKLENIGKLLCNLGIVGKLLMNSI